MAGDQGINQDTIRLIAHTLREARHVVVLTGAGISAESGIPTFRDALDGHWAKLDPMQLATPEAFARDPGLVSRWYDERRLKVAACAPNPGHHALVKLQNALESRSARFTLLTQNVDGLHQRAGSRDVVELHGSLRTWRCTATGRDFEPGPQPFGEFPQPSPYAKGAFLRPGVVWFGEMLPEAALTAAEQAVESCDVFLSIGTSAVVQPAASFVQVAGAHGARTIEINRDPTPVTRWVEWSVLGKAGEVLPRIIGEM